MAAPVAPKSQRPAEQPRKSLFKSIIGSSRKSQPQAQVIQPVNHQPVAVNHQPVAVTSQQAPDQQPATPVVHVARRTVSAATKSEAST